LEGSSRAQEILYERYKKSVKNFLKSKYSTYYDLEDDVSEIMIKVFMNLSTYDSQKSKFRSWVFSIAKNHMVDKWRSNTITLSGGNESYSYTPTTDNVEYSDNIYVTNASDLSVEVGNNVFFTSNCCADYDFENCSSINYVSGQISSQDFTLLDMKYVQGYDYNEIGSEFNLTSSTVSNRVNYIKTKLKKNNPEIIYE
jgi:RNA polymerase sigma factor (sigma-70 family)